MGDTEELRQPASAPPRCSRLSGSHDMHGRGGSSLLAFVLALAILGILAAMVLATTRSSTGGPTDGARSSDTRALVACKADAKAMLAAVEAVKAHEGSYPTTEQVADLSDASKGGLLMALPAS